MTELPFGEWPSPISAASLVRGAVGIGEVVPDGEDVWWAESRPSEGGRTAVMRWRAGRVEEITPSDAYVRTLVHEYGGGAWWVHDGVLFYADLADQRLRRLTPGGEPLLLTPVPERERGLRYADGRTTPDGRWYVCVRERHEGPGAETEAVNELVAVATDGSENVVSLWRGSDFVMSPRLSAAGDRLAWIAWDHPDMPWDSTELWTAEIGAEPRSGAVGERLVLVAARVVAGNGDEALCEPGWGPDGELYVVSDRHEWWNLHRVDGSELVAVVEGDFEVATPPWVFGMQRWAIVGARTGDGAGDGTPVVVAGRSGGDTLVAGSRPIDTVDRTISSLHATPAGGLVFAGSGFGHETEVVRLALADGSTSREVLRPARDLGLDPAFLTPPEPLSFPTGGAGDARAHALLYRPAHPEHRGPADSRPPLMVLAHGGPTGQARRQLQLAIRFWTSRGIAVVDVDYRGSTGYGRAYRRSLRGRWGLVDVDDCVAVARFLAERGDVDPARLLIRGGSAGGYTVLASLCFHDVFAAGASHYGIADLEALAIDTHKFESRYLDGLVGAYPAERQVYVDRSPIHHVDGFAAPMIVLQGDEDEIVPPGQAEMIVAALEAKGVPVAYLLFEGEQHGFRKAENVIRALESELAFFGRVLGFDPADDLPPVKIAGLV